jgi:drug/metabolite transporter (DMT)-like permease
LSVSNQNKAYLFAISAVLLWSTIASAFKITLNYIDYIHLLLLASVFSSIALFTILLFQRKFTLLKQVNKNDLLRSSLLGLLNPFLYYLVLLKAYTLLKAQEAGTLNYIWPITLVLLSIPLLKQKINWISILAILISFFGIIIISTEGRLASLEFREPMGVFLALISSVFWAIYWIYNLKDNRDEIVKLFVNFMFGTIYILITVLVFSDFRNIRFNGIIGAAYIGLFEMGITYFLWLKALKLSINTARVANLVYISPFISLMIIRNVVGEKILVSTVIGLVFIISGIIIQQISTGQKK